MEQKKEKMTIPEKVRHFLVPESTEDLFKDVEQYTNYAQYNLASDFTSRSVLNALKDVPSMMEDPICSSAVKCIMQTAFQTDSKDRILSSVNTAYSTIKAELDKFHEEINVDNFLLLTGFNNLLWGQLPWKHCYNKEGVLERVIPIPDFTSITPVIVSGRTVGFMDDEGNFVPSYMYTYSQLAYYKNLGGNTQNMYLTVAANNDTEETFRNEFTYANSYLGSTSKAWRNINIIEDALLLNRMDQSNYYRIISVNVGGQVYSKSAIQVLNYYRNLFKKVRRVDYDSTGMSSRGNGQNFEVIVPQSTNQGVDIKNVGGEIDVKALKDLDTQYQRLFAALQIQPSMIGFSDEMPSSLGEGPATAWDKRFAKVCKTVWFSAANALKNIDYLHLRSLGYNVDLDDWSYGTISQTIQEDADKGETLKLAVENLKSITESLNNMNAEYDKVYLTKNLLGSALGSFGVDVEQLMAPKEDIGAPEDGPTVLGASFKKDNGSSFRKEIMSADAHAMALAGIFEERTAKQIVSAFEKENLDNLSFKEKLTPLNLKQLCSSVAVRKDTPIDLKDILNRLNIDAEGIQNKFEKSKVEQSTAVDFQFPIFCSKDIEVTAGDLDLNSTRCIKNMYIDNLGNQYLTSKTDVITYLYNYMNGSLDNYCENVWRLNK